MKNPRPMMWRLLALITASLGLCLVSVAAAAQDGADLGPAVELGARALVPDVALLVDDLGPEAVDGVVSGLSAIDGVGRATSDVVADGGTVFYLTRADTGGGRPLDAIISESERVIDTQAPDAMVLVGGSAIVDRSLADRFGNSAAAVAVVGALLGAALGLVFGLKRGVLTAVALALTVVCAGNIGSQVGGRFDGTMSTTALPGALAGLLVGVGLAVRLLVWFRNPTGVDGAETIRHSVLELLPELALLFSGLIVTTVVVELLDPGRSPFTVVTIAALVAVVVLAAVLTPGLTILAGEPEPAPTLLPLSFPDGRDLPLLVLVAVGLVLAALSLFAYRPPATALLDAGRLPDDDPAARVAARLLVGGGDATNALVATRPAATSQVDFEGWAGAIVERPEVERVDTAAGRFLPTGRAEVDAADLLVPPEADGAAVIVLNVAPRSEQGQAVTAGLSALPLAGGQARFSGDAADAALVAGSASTIVVAVIVLAAVGAAAVQVLTQNTAQSIIAFLLRLLAGGATVGVHRLMIPDTTMAEALTVLVLVVGLGVGLFELEFLGFGGAPDRSGSDRFPNPGQNAAFGLAALGLSGVAVAMTVWFGGGPGTGGFGLGLLAAVLVELLAGVLLLRPALLGQRAAFHTAVRPVRVAMHSGTEQQPESSGGPEDPTWRRVVGDLLQAEFRLQSHPADAELELVFVPDTPLFRQAESHHRSLADAGLRIVGRSPRLRSLKTVSGRSPITLAVTVDHPERQLVDGEGTVVGVRKPERRSGVLWLSTEQDGSFRIAESVELGATSLPDEGAAASEDAAIPGVMEEPPPQEHLAP